MWVNTVRLLCKGGVGRGVGLYVALWVLGVLQVLGGLWVGILMRVLLVGVLWVGILWVRLMLEGLLVLEPLLDH